ncbi:MAG TPA: hypothetical protein VNE71_16820, partial [Myxococcota bacterium]|nr:hypothetical protein [Myxococcota bacterium]
MSARSSEGVRPRALALAAGPLLALATALALACAGELALRAAPHALLPKGMYGAGRFDRELGLAVAGSRVYYNRVRFVVRDPNSLGFMDVEHAAAKPPGTLRVGFFGDSYVESVQVPLESAFFRLLPRASEGRPVEALAFGVSGWGTLHAFRAAETYVPHFALDRAVYVFVENDPADSSYAVQARKRRSPLVLAESSPTPPGYALRWDRAPGEEAAWLPVAKAIQRHSLLAQLVVVRIRLLRGAGIQIRTRADSAAMAGRGRPEDDPAALPTTWLPELRDEAARVSEAILAHWGAEASRAGVGFSVLYVPRNEDPLAEPGEPRL